MSHPAHTLGTGPLARKAHSRARLAAAHWVQLNRPGVWREILAFERTSLGLVATTPETRTAPPSPKEGT